MKHFVLITLLTLLCSACVTRPPERQAVVPQQIELWIGMKEAELHRIPLGFRDWYQMPDRTIYFVRHQSEHRIEELTVIDGVVVAMADPRTFASYDDATTYGRERKQHWVKEKRVEIRRQRIKELGLDPSPEVEAAILGNAILIGMNADEVKASWGEPESRNIWGGNISQQEQWVFRHQDGISADYLFFENGKVRSWRVTR